MNSINTAPTYYSVSRQAPRVGEAIRLNALINTGRLHTLIVNGDNPSFGGDGNRSLNLRELVGFGNQLGQVYNYYSQQFYTSPDIQGNPQARQAWSQALNNMYTDLRHVNLLGSNWNTIVGKPEFSVDDLMSLANRDNQWQSVSQFDLYGRQA